MKGLILCFAALLTAQIAVAEEVTPKPAPEEEPKQICTREKPVGTNRPVRVCRDAEAAQLMGERSRAAFENARQHRSDWREEVR